MWMVVKVGGDWSTQVWKGAGQKWLEKAFGLSSLFAFNYIRHLDTYI